MAPNHWRFTLLLPTALAGLTLGCAPPVVEDAEPVVTSVAPPATVAPVAPTPTTSSGSAFTAADGRFSAQFPVPPERAEGASGGMTFILYSSAKDGRDLSVGYVDFPKGSAGLKDQRELLRLMAEEEGTLSSKNTTYLGRPALDIVVARLEDGVKGFFHERSFLAGNRMYSLRGWSTTPAPPPEHATLLTTFKLTG